MTERVRHAVDRAVRALGRHQTYRLDADVVHVPVTAGDVLVRIPEPGDQDTRREITEIPPHELANALLHLLRDARAADDEALLTRVRQLFGFERTGGVIRATLDQAIHTLLDDGTVTRGPDGLLRPSGWATNPPGMPGTPAR